MTHIGELEDGACLEFHVLALDFAPDFINGFGDELGLVSLVGAKPADEVLQCPLPHVMVRSKSRRSGRYSNRITLANVLNLFFLPLSPSAHMRLLNTRAWERKVCFCPLAMSATAIYI